MVQSQHMDTRMKSTSAARIGSIMQYMLIPSVFAVLVIMCYTIIMFYDRDIFGNSWKYVIPHPAYTRGIDNEKIREDKSVMQNKTYKILFWDGVPPWLDPKEIISTCKYPRCTFGGSRSDIKNSDAVFFHGPFHRGQLPSKQNGQVWIFMCLESPQNTRNFQHFNGKINWTWAYRRDSDIVGTYGTFRKSHIKTTTTDMSLKSKPIAWYVSNCYSKSKRLKYVELMKKYINVDVYGACGNLKCSRGAEESCRDLLKTTYNFYLSFENSFCRDYVTEKALIRIRDYVVPVVRGGSNYSLYLPPNSYIDTSNYRPIEKLSQKLQLILSDQSEYKLFHRWRPYYFSESATRLGWCEICRRLHIQEEYKRLYNNFQAWWTGNDQVKICSEADDVTTS